MRALPRWRTRSRAQTSSCSRPGSTRPGSWCPPEARLLENKVVVDPSNPIGFDENGQMFRTLPEGQSSGSVVAGLLPASAHYVKAFGTLGAGAARDRREPRAADRSLLRHRRRRCGGDRPTPDQGSRLRAVEGGRRLRRGSNRGPRRRAPGADLRSRRGAGHHRNGRSKDMSATDTATLPDYAPIPRRGARAGPQRAGLLRRPSRAEPLLRHGRHLHVGVPDDLGRRRRARRAADAREQHPARDRRDRLRERRQQQGRVPHLLAPPLRPRRRGVAVRQERDPHRARGDAERSCCGTTTRRGLRTRRRSRTSAPSRSAVSGSTSPGTAPTTRPTTSSSTCPATTR